MFIWNKNKHFSKIIVEFFNNSMADIRELNVILTSFGAKPIIEADKEKFVLKTFLFLMFFQECALQKKYYPKYKEEVSVVLDAMIYKIADRYHYIPQKLTDGYLGLRKLLDNMTNVEQVVEIGLYYIVAVGYLQMTFSGKYNPGDVGIYDDRVEYALANFFQRVTRDNMNYLGLK